MGYIGAWAEDCYVVSVGDDVNVCWWIRNVTDIGIEEGEWDDGALWDTKMNGILGGYLVFVSGVGLSTSQVGGKPFYYGGWKGGSDEDVYKGEVVDCIKGFS